MLTPGLPLDSGVAAQRERAGERLLVADRQPGRPQPPMQASRWPPRGPSPYAPWCWPRTTKSYRWRRSAAPSRRDRCTGHPATGTGRRQRSGLRWPAAPPLYALDAALGPHVDVTFATGADPGSFLPPQPAGSGKTWSARFAPTTAVSYIRPHWTAGWYAGWAGYPDDNGLASVELSRRLTPEVGGAHHFAVSGFGDLADSGSCLSPYATPGSVAAARSSKRTLHREAIHNGPLRGWPGSRWPRPARARRLWYASTCRRKGCAFGTAVGADPTAPFSWRWAGVSVTGGCRRSCPGRRPGVGSHRLTCHFDAPDQVGLMPSSRSRGKGSARPRHSADDAGRR